jgi:hypothetical protein
MLPEPLVQSTQSNDFQEISFLDKKSINYFSSSAEQQIFSSQRLSPTILPGSTQTIVLRL